MKDIPTMVAHAHSDHRSLEKSGSEAPAKSPIATACIGRRTPIRSDRRPAATADSIGSSA